MHKKIKKITALILAVVLILSVFICPVYAEKGNNESKKMFQCDWFAESLFYDYEYSDKWFSDSAYIYNHDRATFALDVSMASFNSFDVNNRDENIREMLEDCGFEVESYGYETEAYDTMGVCFGKREIADKDGKFTLVIMAIRSGNYGMEWGGNMRIGKGMHHEGFEIASGLVIEYLNEYLGNNSIDGRIKILTSGYSRGGSVTNITAAALDDGTYTRFLDTTDYIAGADIKGEDLYAYTFEAPQCTMSNDINEDVYSNIFNVTNPSDYVTKFVLSDWGYSLYGQRYYLPSAETVSDYSDYYNRLCSTFDEMMAVNEKSSEDFFYDAEKSRSENAMMDRLIEIIGKEVFVSRDYYVDNYQEGIIFIAGQYLGQQLSAVDAMKTFAVVMGANVTGILPGNINAIKNDGYRRYLAQKIASSDAGQGLSVETCDSLITVMLSIMNCVHKNRMAFAPVLEQLKTFIYVHQPFIELTWMRAITQNEMNAVNTHSGKIFTIYNTLNIKYRAEVKAPAVCENGEKIKWVSDNKDIVNVDSDGVIKGTGDGTAVVSAILVDKNGKEIDRADVTVTVHMNGFQRAVAAIKSIF